jgi:hypothetical protein
VMSHRDLRDDTWKLLLIEKKLKEENRLLREKGVILRAEKEAALKKMTKETEDTIVTASQIQIANSSLCGDGTVQRGKTATTTVTTPRNSRNPNCTRRCGVARRTYVGTFYTHASLYCVPARQPIPSTLYTEHWPVCRNPSKPPRCTILTK